MFYHVLIETSEKIGKSGTNKTYFERDKTDISEIKKRIVLPYLRKEDFQFNGYFLEPKNIRRITIKSSTKTTEELSAIENNNLPPGFITFISPEDIVESEKSTKEITKDIFDEAKKDIGTPQQARPSKALDLNNVFIVHGHDDLTKTKVARFIEKLGFNAIILHEQASSGKTIIEKIEAHTNVGFALILYTPCDAGRASDATELNLRARQNVVFEHGYLIGKLGRQNVCALVKDNIEIPNDISGIVYIPLDPSDAWTLSVAKELRHAGYAVDMNKVI